MAPGSLRKYTLRNAFLLIIGYEALRNLIVDQSVRVEPHRVILSSQGDVQSSVEEDYSKYTQPSPPTQQHTPASDSFSACLLIMDDNHFITEWLAYHYHVLPLRNLIVAVDPRSSTSPASIFDRWKETNLNITVWWNDSDYIADSKELDEAESRVQRQFQADNPSPQLIRHRARQRLFYYHCLQEHKRQNRTFTLLTDTDEYLTVNYETVQKTKSPTVASLIPSIAEPGSVLKLLQHEQKYHLQDSPVTSSPCIQIPRSRFGAIETTDEESAPTNNLFALNASQQLGTLRWRYHADPSNYHHNRISKTVLDVSRIEDQYIQSVDSIHRPVKHYCSQRNLHIRAPEQLLLIHHYLGSWEQYSFRQGDARMGNERSRNVSTFSCRE